MYLHPYFVSLALTIGTSAALAADRLDCTGNEFQVVTALAALPDEVLASLKHQRRGFDPEETLVVVSPELADRGEAFTAGDTGGGPSRRFALAAVGQGRVFAAVEHGGFAYNVEIWSFELDGTHWFGDVKSKVPEVPASLSDLLALTCNQLGPRAPLVSTP